MTWPRRLRRAVTLGAIGVVLVPIAACSDDEPKQGEADLELDGSARVERQDGDDVTLDDDDTLRVGDQITIEEGDAVVRLPGGSVLELRAARNGVDATVLVLGPKPVLESGDLLVIASEDEDVAIDVDGTDVVVSSGAARLGRGAGASAGSYTADVHLDSAGEERDIPPLRQMSVATLGQPPVAPSPFTYRTNDPWDRRFLGKAIDLGDRVAALSSGFTQNLRSGQGGTAAFFAGVLPGLATEASFTDALIDPDRDAGETLVGAAITMLGQRGTFPERYASVFSFRDDGAEWGLVALDQGVASEPLLAALQAAIDAAPLDTATTTRTTPSSVSPVVPPTTVAPSRPAPSDPAPPTTRAPLPTPGEKDHDNGLLAPILNPLLEPVTDVLNSLVGGLLGGLTG